MNSRFVLTLALAVVGCSPVASDAHLGLAIEPNSVDLGKIECPSVTKHRIVLRNTTKSQVFVRVKRVSCGCFSLRGLPTAIGSQQESVIDVDVSLNNTFGLFTRYITLQSSTDENFVEGLMEREIRFRGESLSQKVFTDPMSVILVTRDGAGEASFRVVRRDGRLVSIHSVTSGDHALNAARDSTNEARVVVSTEDVKECEGRSVVRVVYACDGDADAVLEVPVEVLGAR